MDEKKFNMTDYIPGDRNVLIDSRFRDGKIRYQFYYDLVKIKVEQVDELQLIFCKFNKNSTNPFISITFVTFTSRLSK